MGQHGTRFVHRTWSRPRPASPDRRRPRRRWVAADESRIAGHDRMEATGESRAHRLG